MAGAGPCGEKPEKPPACRENFAPFAPLPKPLPFACPTKIALDGLPQNAVPKKMRLSVRLDVKVPRLPKPEPDPADHALTALPSVCPDAGYAPVWPSCTLARAFRLSKLFLFRPVLCPASVPDRPAGNCLNPADPPCPRMPLCPFSALFCIPALSLLPPVIRGGHSAVYPAVAKKI